jgi:ADP-L-glycero-D-manno-heptose 6-epimerase
MPNNFFSTKQKSPFCGNLGRILVTGGAGFIGSALVHVLNRQGWEDILITDFFGKGDKWKNLRALRFDDCLPADRFMQKLEQSAAFYGDFSAVFHLGACSSTVECNLDYLLEKNYYYSLCLAKWALARGIRFVYASSAATYGDGAQGLDDKNDNLYCYRPLNPYAYSKHLFDVYAQKYGLLKHMVGIKYFNVFGPNEYHKGGMRSLVCKAYEQILDTGVVKLFRSSHPGYRDGEQKRDFIYVRDAVKMTLHLAATSSAVGLFNVGSGMSRTWVELANTVFSVLGCPPRVEFVEMPESVHQQYQYFTCADISKLRLSGYSCPITPFEDSIREYIMHYLLSGVRLGDEKFEQT